MMIYTKSLIAGVLVSLCGALLVAVVAAVFVRLRFHTRSVGFNISLLGSPGLWAFLLILFLVGFILEFQRLRAHLH